MTEESKGYYTPLHVTAKKELEIYKEIHRVESEGKEEISKVNNKLTELNASQQEQIQRQKEGNDHLKIISESVTEFKNWSVGVDSKITKQEERLTTMETSIAEKSKANSGIIIAAIGAFATISGAAFTFAAVFFN